VRHWWLAACLPLLLAACIRRPVPAPVGGSERPGAPASKKEAAPKAPPAASRPALPPVTPEQAMLALPAARLQPEDFVIGPLADRLAGSRSQRLARAAAARFLAGLAGGTVPAAELLPERREELERSLQYYLDHKLLPSRYRLGPLIELGEGSLRCRLRLFGSGAAGFAPGTSSGELYLSYAGERWYVADAQVGLAALAEPSPRRQEKYVPSEVR
jgi:hypothetical protein